MLQVIVALLSPGVTCTVAGGEDEPPPPQPAISKTAAQATTKAKTFFISNALYFQRGYCNDCNDTRMRTPAAAAHADNGIPVIPIVLRDTQFIRARAPLRQLAINVYKPRLKGFGARWSGTRLKGGLGS
jgi:hypothetical protein